jgi:hypothetical protein
MPRLSGRCPPPAGTDYRPLPTVYSDYLSSQTSRTFRFEPVGMCSYPLT